MRGWISSPNSAVIAESPSDANRIGSCDVRRVRRKGLDLGMDHTMDDRLYPKRCMEAEKESVREGGGTEVTGEGYDRTLVAARMDCAAASPESAAPSMNPCHS